MNRLILLTLLCVACRSQNPPETIGSRDLGALEPSSGAVSVKLLPDPQSPDIQLGPDEQFVPARLVPFNPAPAYPTALVPLHLAPHSVAMRVTFDEEGRVISVVESPVAASTESEHRPAFEAATRATLEQWKCYPSRIRKFRPGPDTDGDGKPDYTIMQADKALKTFFDVSFEFAVVNGVPVVKPGP